MDGSLTNRDRFVRIQRMPVILSLYLFLLLAMVFPTPGNAESLGQEVDPKVEEAVLSEDWPRVGSLLDYVTPENPSPVLRLIKAHADLAVNRNNASLSLLVQLTLDDLKIWQSWSASLAVRHETKSSPHYFLGDAAARSEDLDQAHAHFSKAIEHNAVNYLAWNARGVTSALQGDYEHSLSDFNRALRIKPEFVDAVSNMGMMRIAQGQGRKGAMRRFADAIKSDPKFALAYHGLGCLELLMAQELAPEENRNLQKALELVPDARSVLVENEGRFADAFLEKHAEMLFADAREEGTAIKKDFRVSQLAGQVEKYRRQATQPDSNFIQRKINGARELVAQHSLAREARSMSSGDLGRLKKSSPAVFGETLNAVSRMESIGEANYKLSRGARNVAGLLTSAGRFVPGAGGPMHMADKLTDFAHLQDQNFYDGYRRTKANMVKAQNHFIQDHIKNGTFRGGTYYKQAQGRSSGMSEYTPTAIPAPSGVRLGKPVNYNSINKFRPAGATTDRTQIGWDDHDWPFLPIFGLLYFGGDHVSAGEGGVS